MKKLRISESDYLLHAINSTTDKANQIINILDNEFENDYVSIKDRMITMFDIKSKQETLSEYNRSFKQTNMKSMTEYYIRFKKKVNEMLAKEIWVPEQTAPLQLVQQFRSKLRLDFESKLTDYLEDKDINQDDLTLEECF